MPLKESLAAIYALFLMLPAFPQQIKAVFPGVGITRQAGDYYKRWRYTERSLGTEITPVKGEELDALKQKMIVFKREVERQREGGDLVQYLNAFRAILELFAVIEPGSLEALNGELAPGVPIVGSLFAQEMKKLKSGTLTEVDFEFELRPLSGELVEVRYSRYYLDNLKTQSELLRWSKNSDELLFSVAKKSIIEQLKNSSEFVDRMMSVGKGEGRLKRQEREYLFRDLLSNSLRNYPQTLEAFTINLNWINPRWSSRFLKILIPEASYSVDSEGVNSFTVRFPKMVEEYLGYSPSIFLLKIMQSDFELVNTDAEKMEGFLCQSFIDSVRESIDQAWLSLAQSKGKEAPIRSFFAQTIPQPSCDFLKQWNVGVQMETAHEQVRHSARNTFSELVKKLAQIVYVQKNSEAFLAESADIESTINYYQIKKLESEMDMKSHFAIWLKQQAKQQSYSEFKRAFNKKYVRQKKMGKQYSASRFLQKVSGVAQESISQMDEMAEFLRLNEKGRSDLLNRELPGISDSDDDRVLLQEIVLEVKKKRYPILQTQVESQALWEKLGDNPKENHRLVLKAMKEIRQKIENSVEDVQSWKDISDMELALKNSRFLLRRLIRDSRVSGFFMQKYEDLQKESDIKLMAKGLFHKYVGVGFGLLILVDFGPPIFKHVFRLPKVASYLRTMQQGVHPRVKHGFVISAFSLIGIDLLYETWDVFGRELPAFRDVRQLFNSSALSETAIYSYPEYLQMDQHMSDRKSGYYWQAAIDGTFISLLLGPRIPWVKRRGVQMIDKMVQNKLSNSNDKIERAFKNLGVDPTHITWNKLTLEDIHRLRTRELEAKLLAEGRKLRKLAKDSRPIKRLRQDSQFKRAVKENRDIRESLAAYDVIWAEGRRVDEGYRLLLKKYAKLQKVWKRNSIEYRFDFEKLGLPVGEWNWKAIDEAYAGFKKSRESNKISVEEFALVQESVRRLADFMVGKIYFLSRYPTLKELFLQSVIRDRGKLFLESYRQRLNEDGLQLGYDVIPLKSDDGIMRELIIPNLYRQELLSQGGHL